MPVSVVQLCDTRRTGGSSELVACEGSRADCGGFLLARGWLERVCLFPHRPAVSFGQCVWAEEFGHLGPSQRWGWGHSVHYRMCVCVYVCACIWTCMQVRQTKETRMKKHGLNTRRMLVTYTRLWGHGERVATVSNWIILFILTVHTVTSTHTSTHTSTAPTPTPTLSASW